MAVDVLLLELLQSELIHIHPLGLPSGGHRLGELDPRPHDPTAGLRFPSGRHVLTHPNPGLDSVVLVVGLQGGEDLFRSLQSGDVDLELLLGQLTDVTVQAGRLHPPHLLLGLSRYS